MLFKANFHFHTSADREDYIRYSTEEGIDRAAKRGFSVLALTCHNTFAWTQEYAGYAKGRGILLIPGIEVSIHETPSEERHTVILNCDKEAENVHSFAALEGYRKSHPDIFVLAPHPYYPHFTKKMSLMERLDEYIDLYDGIEQSWFYSRHVDRNKQAEVMAKRHNLPYISTSDTHFFNFLDTDYCVIEADEKTPEALFRALRAGSYRNMTRPKKLVSEMLFPMLRHTFNNHILHQRAG